MAQGTEACAVFALTIPPTNDNSTPAPPSTTTKQAAPAAKLLPEAQFGTLAEARVSTAAFVAVWAALDGGHASADGISVRLPATPPPRAPAEQAAEPVVNTLTVKRRKVT